MKKGLLVFLGSLFVLQIFAQTGIGTTTPNASAKLDVFSDNKGFLPPRVTLTSATDNTTVPSPAEGLLVYNKGSVGLQAGYYYWNGANWATIATATSAGNGVTASDMVKIYDGVGNAATINSTGATFTVTTSGRYSFDFSTAATCNGCMLTLNFQVRDGANSNAVIASDMQTSYSNNIHAEYNGKVEVNLLANRSYNVLVTASSGGIYSNDYTRVYMKQVSGNLPVTGQTVDYVSVGTIYQTAIGDNRDLIFTSKYGGNIPYNTSTGVFTLSANKTYLFQAQVRANTPSVSSSYIEYGFVDATTNALLVNGTETITSSTTATGGYGSNPVINFIYTPTTNQTVKLRTTVNTNGTQTIVSGSANITQIGSSAIINPWTLSGTNTYNTTGNVGIGNNAPTSTLDVTGTLGVSGTATLKDLVKVGTGIGDEGGEINFAVPATNTTLSTRVVQDIWQNRLRFFDGNAKGVFIDLDKAPTGVSGEISYKASGIVNAGTFVQLDNLKATVTTSGNRSLGIASVSGSFAAYVNGSYTVYSGGSSGTGNYLTVSTTLNYAINWNFTGAGDLATYIINDVTNGRVYRVIMMIGPGYNYNFISIERLH